jgi:hypothetical protein
MDFLPLPKNFDANEIFVLIIAGGLFLISLSLPKRFPLHLFIPLFLVNSFIGRTADISLGIAPFNAYNSFDESKHELFDNIMYLVIYPIYGYLFFYFYDIYDKIPSWIQIVGWAAAGVLFEWISLKFHVFQYNNWIIGYSFPIYVFVYTFHSFFFKWICKQLRYNTKRNV